MLKLILHLIRGPLRDREALILENVALRHQLQALSRGRKRPALKNHDRMVWILLRRAWQGWRKSLVIVQPETVIRWNRRGFRRSEGERVVAGVREGRVSAVTSASSSSEWSVRTRPSARSIRKLERTAESSIATRRVLVALKSLLR